MLLSSANQDECLSLNRRGGLDYALARVHTIPHAWPKLKNTVVFSGAAANSQGRSSVSKAQYPPPPI